MRTISYKLDDLKKVVIPIGYEGENDHTRVIIDAGEVFKQYPAAAATLKVKPPHGTIYPVVVSREGDTVIWDVKETDCASNGTGEAQFTFTENSVIVKSMVTKININRSLVATGPAPDPIEDWLDEATEVLDDLGAMDNIAKNAQASDIGKSLSPKTVVDGVVTEWQYVEQSGGTEDYTDLENKPSIAGVTLSGDKSLTDLGIASASTVSDLAEDVSDVKTAIHGMDSFEYKFSETDLLIAFGYSNTDDYVIVMNEGRANGLFDFSKLCTKPRNTSLKDLETADLTTVWTSGTDFHSPFKFLATSNADGYHYDATSPGFVGGNHTLDGMGDQFKTASSVYVKYYADGVPVSSGCGKANSFGIKWANDVQAYNTVKQGGGGRACLREHHDMIFDGVLFREKVTLEPLEEISMKLWYGLQCASIGATYDSIAFVDATNRGVFAYNDQNVKSGNAVTSGLNCWGNTHKLEMSVDTNIDLGKRTYYSGDSGAFCTTTKGYFYIIGQTITMAKGDLYYLYGSYRFMKNITAGNPCTGIVLDQNTLLFESAEESKTLTATVTPADTTDTVIWSSSNENVATVNNGVVTIHGIGTATITATCGNQTATATINQQSIKSQYTMKVVDGKYPNNRTLGDDQVLSISTLEGQKAIGQAYHEANTDLHVYSGQTNDIECIRVPYGATAVKVKTSDDVAVSISYVCVGDTTSIITYNNVDYAEYVSKTANVNTNTGLTVEYGQCVIIRVKDEQYPTLQYVYFT